LLFAAVTIFFMYPSFKWYFATTPEEKNEVSISRERLKDLVVEKVDATVAKLNKNEKISDAELKVIEAEFIKNLNDRNNAIDKANRDVINYNKKNPKDPMKAKERYTVKKSYTYNEMKEIMLNITGKEKRVESFFRVALENYHDVNLNARKDIKDKIIKLGLDLQGGAYAVITINFNHPKVRELYPGGITKDKKDYMINNAMSMIQNRINKYGLSEIDIKKLKDQEQIVVTLPGVKEISSLSKIIETVGVLDFKIVSKEGKAEFDKIVLDARKQGKPLFDQERRLLPEFQAKLDAFSASKKLPLLEVLFKQEKDKWGIEKEEIPIFVVERDSLFNKSKTDPDPKKRYINISSATVDKDNMGRNVVNFSLEGDDIKTWANVTGNNVGKEVAIILDDYVLHAPSVREKIPNGRSQITLGDSPLEDLRNLALILRAGSLDVPLVISEQQVIGPSLGRDTIQKGIFAVFLGLIFVITFMMLYYSVGGIISDFAMFLNLVFLTGGLALFNATLTLPGIAGYILTVGMSVDANVIIFERVKEEFRAGKPFGTALNVGYNKAFWTIFDSQLTTFAAGIGLALFGTGPIKGFAVTLCLGIVISMYTALVITKLIFDILVKYHEFKSLRVINLLRGN
jgi:protein-export membrane protein SecD